MALSPALSVSLLLLFICGSTSAQNPLQIVSKAVQCFNNQNVYRKCQEDYRLSPAGNINVPSEATNAYCGGPCLIETKLVLDCVDGIMSNFIFYNRATTKNIRSTLVNGCSQTSSRGNFNVADYLEESNGGDKQYKPVYYIWVLLALGLLML